MKSTVFGVFVCILVLWSVSVLCFLQGRGPWGLHPGGVQQESGWNNRPGSPAADSDRNQGAVGHQQSLCPPEVSILFLKTWQANPEVLTASFSLIKA